jgi:hypothetical protein
VPTIHSGLRRRRRRARAARAAAATPGPARPDHHPAPAEAGPPPIPPTRPPILYFAYGANMDPAVLARRGVAPSFATPAVLVGPAAQLRLAFAHRAAFATLVEVEENEEEGGGLTVPPPRTHGVLYGLDRDDWAALARAEVGYTWRPVEVEPYEKKSRGVGGRGGGGGGGETQPPASTSPTTLTARTFVSSPLHRLKGGRALPPPRPYLARLVAGVRARGVEESYCQWLEARPTVDPPQGFGLSAAYFETPGRDLIVGVGLGLAAGMVGWALAGSV